MNRNSNVPKCVRRIEVVQRRSIMYYQTQASYHFLKIVVALPTMVTSCRGKYSETKIVAFLSYTYIGLMTSHANHMLADMHESV